MAFCTNRVQRTQQISQWTTDFWRHYWEQLYSPTRLPTFDNIVSLASELLYSLHWRAPPPIPIFDFCISPLPCWGHPCPLCGIVLWWRMKMERGRKQWRYWWRWFVLSSDREPFQRIRGTLQVLADKLRVLSIATKRNTIDRQTHIGEVGRWFFRSARVGAIWKLST